MKLLVSLVLLIGTWLPTQAFEKLSVEVQAEHLSGGSYYVPGLSGAATEFEGFISNAGFVVTTEGVVVIDALGTPALANAMLGEIRKVTDQPIKLVISTHYHADHIYGLQVFKAEGAQIWAPKGTLEYLDDENSHNLLESRRTALFPWVDENTHLVTPDRILDAPETFTLGEHEFRIDFFGSVHSTGDMSLTNITDRTLYIGDVIFAGRIPFVGDADVNRWIATLEQMMTVKVDKFVPGHGLASDDAQASMTLTYRYLQFLLAQLTPAVEDMAPFDEVYSAIDFSEFEEQPAFEEANRRNTYAVYLYLERTLE